MKASSFDEFYQEQWGERWPALRQALNHPEHQVARRNAFSDAIAETQGVENLSPAEKQNIPRGSEGLLGFFIMDPGSIRIAKALLVQPGDKILDLCAAPGGKSLVLIEDALQDGNESEVILNEISEARRERLKKVIQQYVPRDVREHVRISGKDGGLFAKSHPEYFDRILIDAPCSGERHLLESSQRLQEWTPASSRRLAQRQYALLTGAVVAARTGARLVYSTCSLSKAENDEVISRLFEKKREKLKRVPFEDPYGKATEWGWQWLPDRCGFGPFYLSVFEKT